MKRAVGDDFYAHYVINSGSFATMEGLLMSDTYPGFPYSLLILIAQMFLSVPQSRYLT
jgi:hypothetical protein